MATASTCSFSLDGSSWAEAWDDAGPVRGPLAHTPGWDVYAITADALPSNGRGDGILHVRRSAPLRSVRVFECWPTADAPLANVLRPEGARSAEVRLPTNAKRKNLFVAVRPPITGAAQSQEETRPKPGVTRSSVAGAPEVGVNAPSLGSVGKATAQGRHSSGSSTAPSDQGTTSTSATVSRRILDLAKRAAPTPQKASSGPQSLEALTLEAELVAKEGNEAWTPTDEEDMLRRTQEARVELLQQKVEALTETSNSSASEVKHLNNEVQRLQEKNAELAKQLRASERERMAGEMRIRNLEDEVQKYQRRRLSMPPVASPASNLEELVKGLVSFELKALDNCKGDDRVAAKRRLLLKWHPDKNEGSELATRVVQELQSRPEWAL